MKKIGLHRFRGTCFVLLLCMIGSVSTAQEDTSDVFVIGDDAPSEVALDSFVVKRREITNCFKLDAGRAYSGVYMMAFEHLIDNDRWSLEYELSYDLDTERFWYDWYTNYKFVEPEDNSPSYDEGFRSSYSFVVGGGVALKHYISKRKSGIYGMYLGAKLKERYGWAFVKNDSNFGAFPSLEYRGVMNFLEASAIVGYSMCFWDFLVVDPFLGPSAILVSTRYASFEEDTNGFYWQEKRLHRIVPALHFGLRIGVSVDNVFQVFF